MQNKQPRVVSVWRMALTNGYGDLPVTGQVTELDVDGIRCFVRENRDGWGGFWDSSNARLRIKQEGQGPAVLDLAAPSVHWQSLSSIVASFDGLGRKVRKTQSWSVKLALDTKPRVRRIGLVACCGRKLERPAPAADLYLSPLFRKARAYVERRCDEWAILSAKHGLVTPSELVEPYDLSLRDLSAAERRQWAADVAVQLRDRYVPAVRIRHRISDFAPLFIVLAGAQYRQALEVFPHEAPLASMGIGRQLAYLGGFHGQA